MRNHMKKALSLMLVLCMTASNLPYMEKTETVHEDSVTSSTESGDVVRGFGNRIKEKKQKKEKFKVNKEDKKGKAWNQRMIQAELPETSDEVIKVAIIDSGINFSTDLNVVERMNFIPDDECLVLYEDISGHGTAVAGIVGALDNEEGITGINPGVELYSARVLDDMLEAPVERIVEAIDWAIEQDVDIINMSFGIEKSVAELEAAIERAAEAGILLIAASGDGDKVAYPAAYDEVIAVGSVTAAGIPAENSAGGAALELMAPGENILSSGIFGGVMGSSGTSMAAPHVVGAASVLMELNPDMPAEYIRALLNYSANLYGDSNAYGNGVVDLEYAIEINDKFQKLYEKYMKKVSKNKNEKVKQKDKFWGEVLKTIPENEKAVETFTEVEVVEGMWATEEHRYFGEVVEGTTIYFTSDQMRILTYALDYPDEPWNQKIYLKGEDTELKGMENNPYHGFLWQKKLNGEPLNNVSDHMNSNYIANYIFMTKLACSFADSRISLENRDGIIENMFDNDSERILKDITNEGVGSKSWDTIFDEVNKKYGVNVENTPENRRLFTYGMAVHLVTDVFAHSAWITKDGTDYVRIKHSKSWHADDTDKCPTRYMAAQQVARNVLGRAYSGTIGSISDFSISKYCFGLDSNINNRFYLGNFLEYAKMAEPAKYREWENNPTLTNIYIVPFQYGDLAYSMKKLQEDGKIVTCDFEEHDFYVYHK